MIGGGGRFSGGAQLGPGGGGRFAAGPGARFSSRAIGPRAGFNNRIAFRNNRFVFRNNRFAFRHRFVRFGRVFAFAGSCSIVRRVWTPWGWSWRRIWVC
jgi:hypothetical protein